MSPPDRFIFHVHVAGAGSYEIGDEIWQQLARRGDRGQRPGRSPRTPAPTCSRATSEASRNELRQQVIAEMTSRVVRRAGDTYRAPDGVRYSLTCSPAA